MSEIQWDDSLSVGIELIDDQHKLLIEKLKELSLAYNEGHEQNELLKTLSFMIDYTDFHFTSEEQEMERNNYPGLPEQKKQHKEFKVTLDNILDDYKDEGPTESLAESINTFLYNWLVGHIKGSDRKLGTFLAQKK